MKKLFAILGFLLGASLIGTTASAASTSTDGRMTFSAQSSLRTVAPPAARLDAAGLREIYSTFSSDDSNLYDCCVAWTLTTDQSILQFQQFVATPFTTDRPGLLRKVQLALSYFTGANSLSISLRADANGLPGKTLHTFKVGDIPPGGSCCDVEVVSPKVMLLRGNTTYWVVAIAKADTWGGWNLNNINANGPFAIDVGSGWEMTSGTLGAFRVLGE